MTTALHEFVPVDGFDRKSKGDVSVDVTFNSWQLPTSIPDNEPVINI